MRARNLTTRTRPTGKRLISLLATLTLIVAACGGDDTTDTTATDGETATTAADGDTATTADDDGSPTTGADDGSSEMACGGPDAEPVEITLWFNGETVPPDEFAALAEDHNITVNFDIRGDDILPLTLQMREAGERLPDIIEIDTNTVPAYIEAGIVQPMDDILTQWQEEDPELYDDVLPVTWDDGTFDGQIYHMANKGGYDIMYYNIDMFEEAGIDVPLATWHDVTEAAITLRDTFPDLSEYFGTGGTSPDRMFYWSYAFGVPFIGAQGNIPDLSSPQGIEMIEWLEELFDEGLVNPTFMIGDQDESQGAFIRDDLPLLDEGSNGGISFQEAGFEYETDFGAFPLPVNEGGERMAVPRGLSVVTDTPNPCEVGLVLRYMSEPEQVIPRFTQLLSSPIRSQNLLDSTELAERLPYFNQEIRAAFSETVQQIPPGTNTLEIGTILKDMLDELTVTGTDESAEDLAARYLAEMQALDE